MREIGDRFSVAERTIFTWVKRKRETGEVGPRARGGGNPARVDDAVLRRLIEVTPDATSWELAACYNRKVGRVGRIHRSSILRALTRNGYVHKKNGFVRRSKIGPMYSRSESASSKESAE
jgi:transposase